MKSFFFCALLILLVVSHSPLTTSQEYGSGLSNHNNVISIIIIFFFFFCCLCAWLIGFVGLKANLTKVSCVGTDDEREWNYQKDSDRGPEHWGDLNENWTICKTGFRQSPIELWDGWADVVRHIGELQTRYKPANATLVNWGHGIMVRKKKGFLRITSS